jgi:hypothetical protein
MRMKRWISLAMAAVMALAVAGIAVAHKNGGQPQSTDQVSATFTATPDPNKTVTRQCTGVDGTYSITKSVANGTTVSDDARLAGNITIKSKSVVNTTTGRGWSDGKVFTTDPATGNLKGVSEFTAVITGGNTFEGFVLGKVKTPAAAGTTKAKKGRNGGGKGRQNGLNSVLRANFSAAVAPDGTISGGLGTGDGNNTAIIHGNPCQSGQSAPQGQNNDGRHGDDEGHGPKGGRNGR